MKTVLLKITMLLIDHDLPDHPVIAVTEHHGVDPLREILQIDGKVTQDDYLNILANMGRTVSGCMHTPTTRT